MTCNGLFNNTIWLHFLKCRQKDKLRSQQFKNKVSAKISGSSPTLMMPGVSRKVTLLKYCVIFQRRCSEAQENAVCKVSSLYSESSGEILSWGPGMFCHSPGSWLSRVIRHRHVGIWSLWDSAIATPGCLQQRELWVLQVAVKAIWDSAICRHLGTCIIAVMRPGIFLLLKMD